MKNTDYLFGGFFIFVFVWRDFVWWFLIEIFAKEEKKVMQLSPSHYFEFEKRILGSRGK